ncbi:Uncharacterised protein [Escherichia coli]|uniref:Galectin domain-containing protein n=1 Tax=Escherichia coli TaxID=562 RepID=A0A376L2X2_ECOLX|nr:Uncharacterised protein [Escherichia coli]
MRLFYLNHSPHSWHWNVRFRPQEAVYTGNDTCHITITCNQSAFHLTRDGQRLFTERYIRNLNELLPVLKTAVGCDTGNHPCRGIPFPGPGITLTFFSSLLIML